MVNLKTKLTIMIIKCGKKVRHAQIDYTNMLRPFKHCVTLPKGKGVSKVGQSHPNIWTVPCVFWSYLIIKTVFFQV